MGEMALHEACRDGMLSVVQTLCSYGCKVDIDNKVLIVVNVCSSCLCVLNLI